MTTNRRPRIGGNPPQYGYLQDEHHDNAIESDSDEYHTSISETGTDGAYGIQLDDGASPQKVHNNDNNHLNYNIYHNINNNDNNPNPVKNTEIELQSNQTEQKNNSNNHNQNVFNDEDNTPSLLHGHQENETKNSDEEDVSDTNSFHDNDRVIEINHHSNTPRNPPKYRKKNGQKNGYHKTHKSSINKEKDRIDKFLNYKDMIFEQYLLPSKGFPFFNFFRFKSQKYENSFPIYIDKQYRAMHLICIIAMILEVVALHFIHNTINSQDNLFPIDIDTNFYVMIAFSVTLLILLLFAGFDSNKYSFSFSLSLGMVLLYLIILYTICGSLTTDKFIIYFLLTLTFNSCLGYIKFTHYIILSFIVIVEFALCIILRWQDVITIGLVDLFLR